MSDEFVVRKIKLLQKYLAHNISHINTSLNTISLLQYTRKYLSASKNRLNLNKK